MESYLYDLIMDGDMTEVRKRVAEMEHNDRVTGRFMIAGRTFVDPPTLIFAVIAQKNEVVDALLSLSFDTEVTMDDGSTALHIAVLLQNQDLINLLLFFGAHIDAKTKIGLTPLMMAINAKDLEIAELLLDHEALKADKIGPLHRAIVTDQPEMVKLIMKYGGDAEGKGKNGKSASELLIPGQENILEILKTVKEETPILQPITATCLKDLIESLPEPQKKQKRPLFPLTRL